MKDITVGGITIQLIPSRLRAIIRKLQTFFGADPGAEPLEYSYSPIVIQDWSLIMGNLFSDTNLYIQVGTGGRYRPFVIPPLQCNRRIGERPLDEDYPDMDWDGTEDMENDTVTLRATFPPGSVKRKRNRAEINEVCICPGGDPPASCLVYAKLTPAVALKRGYHLRVTVRVTCSRYRIETPRSGEAFRIVQNFEN